MRIPQLGQWEPVQIEWSDANGGTEGWGKVSNKERSIHGVMTVRMVESQDVDRLTVVLSLDPDTKQVRSTITIPVSAITGVVRLIAK